jgi:hypothetical protein
MNKYEEAFHRIDGHIIWEADEPLPNGYIDHKHFSQLYQDEFDLIQELVERATPKKPIYVNRGHECPTCSNCDIEGELGYQYKYCSECGQTIDWSSDD